MFSISYPLFHWTIVSTSPILVWFHAYYVFYNAGWRLCEYVVAAALRITASSSDVEGQRNWFHPRLKCVIIKITSSSIMALPFRSSPSHRCEGYLHRVIVVADFDLSPGLGEGGGGVRSAGWLNLLSGRWAAQGPFSPLEAFSDTCPIQLPSAEDAGLTARLRSWSLRGRAASITVRLSAPLLLQRRGGGEGSSLTHIHIIYQDFTVIQVERGTFTESAELWVINAT